MSDDAKCVLDQGNGPRRLLDVIGEKWSLLAIYALQSGKLRFNAIQRTLPGVSQKMLAQTLRRLETAGFVNRRMYPEVPPRVEYELTPLGQSLAPVTEALCSWYDAHGGRIGSRDPGRA